MSLKSGIFFILLVMKNFLFLFLTIVTWSQNLSIDNNFFRFNDENLLKEELIISAKNCYIRSEPNTNSILLDSLQLGNKVNFIKDTEIDINIKGLELSWVEVEYSKGNQIRKGYLWKGFIAISVDNYKDYSIITSVDRKFIKKTTDKDNNTYDQTNYGFTIKLLEKDHFIKEKSFVKNISDNMSSISKTISNWGLKEIDFIYKISFIGEACAIPTEDIYFGWNGKEMLKIIEKYSVGDGNAYYYSEELIFPKEKNGQANTIIKKSKDATNDDDSLETSKFTVKEKTEYFLWDGKQLKLEKTIKKKPYKEIY